MVRPERRRHGHGRERLWAFPPVSVPAWRRFGETEARPPQAASPPSRSIEECRGGCGWRMPPASPAAACTADVAYATLAAHATARIDALAVTESGGRICVRRFHRLNLSRDRAYIIPPGGIPGMPPADFSSGFSATMHSVVSSRLATEAAFCSALRTTLVGSMIPAFIRSSNSSVAALKPKGPLLFLILSTTT